MHNRNGNPTAPPVPPRRAKRRIKDASPAYNSATEVASRNLAGSRRKHPPPPPPPECRRNNKSRSAETYRPSSQCDTASHPVENVSEQHHRSSRRHRQADDGRRVADTATSVIEATFPRSRDTISARESVTMTNQANADPVPRSAAEVRPKPPFLSRDVVSTRDKYPPLFFTMRDFQDVMSAAWNGDDSANASVFVGGTDDSREKGSSIMRTTTLDDDDEEVCFRVTTTRFPFERCLERWRGCSFDEFAQKPDDDRRFEDSANNGDDRANIGQPSGCDVVDKNDDSSCRVESLTKVRFLIESPSASTTSERNSDVKTGGASSATSRDCVPGDKRIGERSVASSVALAEIQGECTVEKDRDDHLRDNLFISSTVHGHSIAREDDPLMSTDTGDVILKTHYDDRNIDANCNFNSISCSKRISNDSREIEEKGIVREEIIVNEENTTQQIDQSGTLCTSPNTNFTNGSLETARRNEEASAPEITPNRKHRQREEFFKKVNNYDVEGKSIVGNEKVFVNEPLRNDLNAYDGNDNVNRVDFDDESNSLAEKSATIEQTRRLSNKQSEETSEVPTLKNNREHASTSTFANTPVKVRRNSFLEAMLADDSTNTTSMNRAIVSIHTAPSIDHERSNKIRELDANITRESGSCELNNAIKVDAENQKVLKDLGDVKEKIAEKTPNSAVKSTRSTSRSAGDVKNDVLNELLSNFSNIKLKIVSPENKRRTRSMGADEDTARPVAVDKRIYGEKMNASFESRMRASSRDEAYDVPTSAEAISSGANNEIAIVEKIVKGEASARTKIEDKPWNLKNDARDPAIGGRIVKDENAETTRRDESFRDMKRDARDDAVIAGKIVERTFARIEERLDIESMETRAKTSIVETLESTKSADGSVRESRKSPNAETTLESADRERQTHEHRKRIPIDAPATMIKIFDSRESEAIADASRTSSLENGGKSVASKKTHSRGEKKTDEEVIAYDEADDRRIAYRSKLALEDSGDKCAIASETTSVTPCNNNDNNRAVTPVAVSKDQSSRDVVTITPGKVRSFIKYYEIRGDVTTEGHSKINDREKVTRRKSAKSRARNSQWPEVTTERERRACGGKCSGPNVLEMSSDKSRFTTIRDPRMSEDPIASSADRKTTEAARRSGQRERKSVATRVHGDETRARTVKAGAKKSVQFVGGFTVIHSRSFDGYESAENWNSRKRRAAPGRPPPSRDFGGRQDFVREIAKSEKLLDVGRDSSRRREVVAEVHAAVDHGKNTGINRLIPKPKTPQLVFYCTV